MRSAPRTRVPLLAGLLLVAAAGHAEPIAAWRQAFLAAAAAPAATESAYADQRRSLAGYVLLPYLDYAWLRQRIDTLDPDTAARFLTEQAGTQLGAQFRRDYLEELARRGDWPAFLALDRAAPATGTALRCQRVRGLLATGDWKAARRELRAVWPEGQSLPEACDEPIATGFSRGWLDGQQVWRRLRLAIEAGNPGLARYLARQLPPAEQAAGERLARSVADPEASLGAAAAWPDDATVREAAAWALRRRARTDVAAAIGHWELLARRFAFTPAERGAILHDLALYAAVAYRPDAEQWFERVPRQARSEQLVDWQLRAALAAGNWPAVLEVATGAPATQAGDARLGYWQGRALAALERRDEARAAYAAVARQANFHGFLAADRLGAPYAICPLQITPEPGSAARLAGDPDVARALELYAVGWRVQAARAWDFARQRLGEADRRQLALLASERGWHDRVVFALNTGDDLRNYALRFPLAERATVERQAALNSLDPAWAYALIRAESAWQPDARSPANAYGLMQLLPGTGRRLAGQLGLDWQGTQTLLDPQQNIRLGTRYLAEQTARFGGNPWLATAAYNAGPTPVQRWLAERGELPADAFIETIPYRETRDYVTRVLAFSVIYDWRLNGTARPLSSRMPDPGRATGPRVEGAPRREVICPA